MSQRRHDQDDEQPGPVASLTSDTTGRERSMPAFRSVVSVLVSFDASYFGQVAGVVGW